MRLTTEAVGRGERGVLRFHNLNDNNLFVKEGWIVTLCLDHGGKNQANVPEFVHIYEYIW